MKSNLYHQQQHNKTFEEDLSFQEWIEYFSTEPTTQELNDMEKVFSKSHVLKPNKHLHPLNNLTYHPLQGA